MTTHTATMALVKAPLPGGPPPAPRAEPPRTPSAGGSPSSRPGSSFRAVIELSKPRITRLVTMTALVGFALSLRGRGGVATEPGGGWSSSTLALVGVGCLVGTYLSSAGANALNQWAERRRDARMARTAHRPLPERRLSPGTAFAAGAGASLLGVLILALACGLVPAAVSAATIAIYVACYTPAKVATPWSTLIGAVPGALPPLIGWTAAAGLAASPDVWRGLDEWGGWSLFILMAVWQLPHFFALAWMYREDYAAGGYRMLPLFDPTGRLTARVIALTAILFIPAAALPALVMPGRLGWAYGGVALVSGLAFAWAALRLAGTMNHAQARRVFLWSVVHLPVLLLAMMMEVVVRATT